MFRVQGVGWRLRTHGAVPRAARRKSSRAILKQAATLLRAHATRLDKDARCRLACVFVRCSCVACAWHVCVCALFVRSVCLHCACALHLRQQMVRIYGFLTLPPRGPAHPTRARGRARAFVRACASACAHQILSTRASRFRLARSLASSLPSAESASVPCMRRLHRQGSTDGACSCNLDRDLAVLDGS